MTNKKNTNSLFLFLVSVFLLFTNFLNAFHLPSKHTPFFENDFTVSLYPKKKNTLTVDGIFGAVSTAFKRNGQSGGTPELYGNYELMSVINSLQAVQGNHPGFVSPLDQLDPLLKNKLKSSVVNFGVSEKIYTVGCAFSYTRWFFDNKIFLGAWLPVLSMQSMNRYSLKQDSSLIGIDPNLVDKVRRDTHQALGFYDNGASRIGFGDLDLHVGYRAFWDHEWLMKAITVTSKMGMMVPTGVRHNINNPSTIPFMGDGHWGLYGESNAQFELKQDLRLGFVLHGAQQFSRRRSKERIPVFKEPAIFSALVGVLDVQPGFTLALAPYLVLENILDNVHFYVKYTYMRHAADTVQDVRTDKTIPSYLNQSPTLIVPQKDIDANQYDKWNISKWRAHYVTLQLMFDTRQTLTSWKLDPTLYLSYDIPCAGRGISKMNQITLGGSVHF